MRIRSAVSLLVFAFLLSGQNLEIRTGLWEISVRSHVSGAPADVVKMTPRAALAPGTRTTRVCVAKDQLYKDLLRGIAGESCKRTVVSSSSKILQIKIECQGNDREMTGTVRYEAVSPESIRGSAQLVSSEPGQHVTFDLNMTGKWVADSCDAVK